MPSLRTLAPSFRRAAESFFRTARRRWPGLVVTSARRTYLQQLRLWQASVAGRNNGLPATPPGSSDHELGLAFDMAHPNIDPLTDPSLPAAGAAWQALGGRWWSGDPVHFAAGGLMWRKKKQRRRRSL
jgi:LAS superfamily LD-carboxypeptidase LdcB